MDGGIIALIVICISLLIIAISVAYFIFKKSKVKKGIAELQLIAQTDANDVTKDMAITLAYMTKQKENRDKRNKNNKRNTAKRFKLK